MKNEMPKSDAVRLKAGAGGRTNARRRSYCALCFKAAMRPEHRSDSTGISGQCEQMARMQLASSPCIVVTLEVQGSDVRPVGMCGKYMTWHKAGHAVSAVQQLLTDSSENYKQCCFLP